MGTIVDKSACEAAGNGQENGLLPVSPFTALQFHFGMLLGVDDLETAQAYPRGKQRLHNAWLHREGVVWGFNVAFNPRQELTVDPGLALDAAGHELHLDRQACLDLGKWYLDNKDDASFTFTDAAGGGKQFSVHVVAKFKACLTRPVPSIVEPCAGSQSNTAYSRVFETVELLLRPGLAADKDRGYHRLRVLFQIEADSPRYADVQTRREQIQALPTEQQPAAYLQALREFAAFDEIDLKPQAASDSEAASIFPEDPTEVVLADLADLIVAPDVSGNWAIAAPIPAPVVTVRPSHIATATIQELLCGPLFTNVAAPVAPAAPAPAAAAPAGNVPAPAATAVGIGDRRVLPVVPSATAPAAAPGGPTITAAQLATKSISFSTSRAIAAATLDAAAVSVSDYDDDDGWSTLDIKAVVQAKDGSIRVDLKEAPAGSLVRLIVRGTGPAPLLAADNHVPLGAPGVGGADDGSDYVQMFKRS